MREQGILIGGLLMLLGGCAARLPFAPDIEMYAFEADRDLSGVWSAEGVDGYQRRIRLTIRPSLLRESAVIRIDVPDDGPATGYAVRTRRSAYDRKIYERRIFAVAPAQLEELDRRIAQSGLWKFEQETWVNKSEDGRDRVCIDGVQLVFERATKEGYHFSEANAQCTAPHRLLEVARQVIALAGLDQAGVELWLN